MRRIFVPILAVLATSCASGPRREGSDFGTNLRALHVSTERQPSPSNPEGRLLRLRLEGHFPLYREAPDGSAVPTVRDLLLEVSLDLPSYRPFYVPTVRLEFRKLSPLLTGPRLQNQAQLRWSAGDFVRYYEGRSTYEVLPNRLIYERAIFRVPLTSFLRLAHPEFEACVGSLSPFRWREQDRGLIEEIADAVREFRWGAKLLDWDEEMRPAPNEDSTPWGAHVRAYVSPNPNYNKTTCATSWEGSHDFPYLRRVTNWIEFPPSPSPGPRVVRLSGFESSVQPSLPDNSKDASVAFDLASIALQTLREELEFAIESPVTVVLFPFEREAASLLVVDAPAKQGLSLGVPSISGEILPKHQSILLRVLAHELTEAELAFPFHSLRSRLYQRDLRNRFLGDGVAELLARMARLRAAREGWNLPPLDRDVRSVDALIARGQKEISIVEWTSDVTARNPSEEAEPKTLTRERDVIFARYAASEYVAHRWYEACRQLGVERPIARLARWLSSQKLGPTRDDLLRFLSRQSKLDVEQLASHVELRAVADYLRECQTALESERSE
ncbi:MAG: hypothetical protein AAF517_03490 [Planctomycetota bacterium]